MKKKSKKEEQTSRTPNVAVGHGPEVSDSLNRLVSRSVLSQSDRVVSRDPDDPEVREGSETNGSSGVRNKVEEGSCGATTSSVRRGKVEERGENEPAAGIMRLGP